MTFTYTFTLKHDSGKKRIKIIGGTLSQAQQTVLDAEGAPESAIKAIDVQMIKPKLQV